jgi:hypothetical protein
LLRIKKRRAKYTPARFFINRHRYKQQNYDTADQCKPVELFGFHIYHASICGGIGISPMFCLSS